jgi:hypothetical protein
MVSRTCRNDVGTSIIAIATTWPYLTTRSSAGASWYIWLWLSPLGPISYDSILLDHLAEHMIYLFTTSSFWFSLNSSYDHGCHLSRQLGMTPKDYKYLLVAANLAHFHQTWGFSIKKMKWKLFLKGHQFSTSNSTGTFEVDSTKFDLNACIHGLSST